MWNIEEMLHGLGQLSWERVDVSFHNSKQRYVAHNTIQVSLIIGVLLTHWCVFKQHLYRMVLACVGEDILVTF